MRNRAGLLAIGTYDQTYGDLLVGMTHPELPREGFRLPLREVLDRANEIEIDDKNAD